MPRLTVLLFGALFAFAQETPRALRARIQEALEAGGPAAAEPHWRRLEEMLPRLEPGDSEHRESAVSLMMGLVLAGQDVRAFRIFDEAVARMAYLGERHPVMLAMLEANAEALELSGRIEKSLAILERVAAADDPSAGINNRRKLAEAYQRAGDFAKAEPLLRELWREASGEDREHTGLAYVYTLQILGKFDQAREVARLMMETEPNEQVRMRWRGVLAGVYLAEGRLAEARELGANEAPQILLCGGVRSGKVLPAELFDEEGQPVSHGTAQRVLRELAQRAERAASLNGRRALDEITTALNGIGAFQPRNSQEADLVRGVLEAALASLDSAHLRDDRYNVDSAWSMLSEGAKANGLTSLAERAASRWIELIEEHRGKDSPSLEMPRELLNGLRTPAPVR